jgi:putative PIN family toxin of toxin-antitoxin system
VKVALDTNVFVSGVFFSGPPYQILEAWRDGEIQVLVSPAILEEYHRVMLELSVRFPEIDPRSLVDFLAVHSEIVLPSPLPPNPIMILEMFDCKT